MIRAIYHFLLVCCCLLGTSEAQAQSPHLVWQMDTEVVMRIGPSGGGYVAFRGQDVKKDDHWICHIGAVNLATGRVAWTRIFDFGGYIRDLHADDRRLYFSMFVRKGNSNTAGLLALDWATGRTAWSGPVPHNPQAIVTGNGAIYWVGPNWDIIAADAASGHVLWKVSPPKPDWTGARFPFALFDGKLYCYSRPDENRVIVFDAKTGSQLMESPGYSEANEYAIERMLRLPRNNSFLLQESFNPHTTRYYGVIHAVTPALKTVWERYGINMAEVNGILLASRREFDPTTGYYSQPPGVMRLDPEDGKRLWWKGDIGDFLGVWQGYAISELWQRESNATQKRYYQGSILGLRPGDGKMVWSIPVKKHIDPQKEKVAPQVALTDARLIITQTGPTGQSHWRAYQLPGTGSP